MNRLQRTVRALFPRSEYRDPVLWEVVEEETTTRVWTVTVETRAEAIQAVDDGQADLVSSDTSVDVVAAQPVMEEES
jgi:hypothetical protein